jgi:hypothetical protein
LIGSLEGLSILKNAFGMGFLSWLVLFDRQMSSQNRRNPIVGDAYQRPILRQIPILRRIGIRCDWRAPPPEFAQNNIIPAKSKAKLPLRAFLR